MSCGFALEILAVLFSPLNVLLFLKFFYKSNKYIKGKEQFYIYDFFCIFVHAVFSYISFNQKLLLKINV